MTQLSKFVVTVECALYHDSKILFIERPKGVHAAGLLSFPGGKFDIEDSQPNTDALLSALKREVYEEVGLTLSGPFQYLTSSCFTAGENTVIDVVYSHQLDQIPATLDVSPREVPAYYWYTPEECIERPNCPPWLAHTLQSHNPLFTRTHSPYERS